MNFPDNLMYTKEHEWIMTSDEMVTVGITDYAQRSLGDVVFVELPEAGKSLSAKESFGVVESVKTVSDLYSPVSGEIVAVNESLEDRPEMINSSPYTDGWIIKVKMSNKGDLEGLLSSKEYSDYVKEEAV